MDRVFVIRQKMLRQSAIAPHQAAVGRLPGGSFVMVDGDRVLGIRQDGIWVGPRPNEASIGLFTGIDLDAIGQRVKLKLNFLPRRIFQLGIRQRILSRLGSEQE